MNKGFHTIMRNKDSVTLLRMYAQTLLFKFYYSEAFVTNQQNTLEEVEEENIFVLYYKI